MFRRKITAIILAAGLSSRMGRLKPLLEFGGESALERGIRLFRSSGIHDVRVVTGYRGNVLAPVVNNHGARCLYNPSYKDGMLSSVKAGVKSLEPDREAFFILPVDVPLVRRKTVEKLLHAYSHGVGRILYPVFRGHRGHPPLVSARFREAILGWRGDGGLKAFLLQRGERAADVPVTDETILVDMDTPADYLKMQRLHGRGDLPSIRECRDIMAEKTESLQNHCNAVAGTALRLGSALNRAGAGLDLDLIVAAALVHDLGKGEADHSASGADRLREMGYPGIADIVAVHMDIRLDENGALNEAEVVYLADKLCMGDRSVTLGERFGKTIERYGDRADIRSRIEARWNTARKILGRIEANTGKNINAILGDDSRPDFKWKQNDLSF